MTIPNLITVFRIGLVPVVILMILGEDWRWAFALFVIAGISDGLDGFVARRFDMASRIGAVLDPLADKVLIAAIYTTLAIVGAIPAWLAIIVVSRDAVIALAFVLSWTIARPITERTRPVSKLTTALQIVLAGLVLGALAFGLDLGILADLLAILVVGFTALTAVLYLSLWLKHMAG